MMTKIVIFGAIYLLYFLVSRPVFSPDMWSSTECSCFPPRFTRFSRRGRILFAASWRTRGTSLTSSTLGDVTGDVTGDMMGDVNGDAAGELTGDVMGDVTSYLTWCDWWIPCWSLLQLWPHNAPQRLQHGDLPHRSFYFARLLYLCQWGVFYLIRVCVIHGLLAHLIKVYFCSRVRVLPKTDCCCFILNSLNFNGC